MDVLKKFWKSPWTIAIVSAVVGPIVTVIIDAILDKPFLTTLGNIFVFCWKGIITFLNFELKLWWVLLGLFGLVLILYLCAKISGNEEEKPEFTLYKEDSFGGWKWSWGWAYNSYDKKWHVKDIQAHCPNCNTPMFHDEYDTVFQCPRCSFKVEYGHKHKTRSEVEALIIDNLNRREKSENSQ